MPARRWPAALGVLLAAALSACANSRSTWIRADGNPARAGELSLPARWITERPALSAVLPPGRIRGLSERWGLPTTGAHRHCYEAQVEVQDVAKAEAHFEGALRQQGIPSARVLGTSRGGTHDGVLALFNTDPPEPRVAVTLCLAGGDGAALVLRLAALGPAARFGADTRAELQTAEHLHLPGEPPATHATFVIGSDRGRAEQWLTAHGFQREDGDKWSLGLRPRHRVGALFDQGSEPPVLFFAAQFD